MRARVSGFDESAGSWDRWESCIQDYFASVAVMRYAGTEGDVIHLQATTEYEARQDFDVDRGTLALRREAYYYDPAAEPGSVMTLSFPQKLPDLRPIFRLDLLFIGFSFSREAGKQQLRECNAELPLSIRQQRNLFNRCEAAPLHQVQVNRELHAFLREKLKAGVQFRSV